MKQHRRVALDGIHVQELPAGSEQSLPNRWAERYIAAGVAEKALPLSPENRALPGAPENKKALPPLTRRAPKKTARKKKR